MSEEERIALREKLNDGLRQSYENLLERKMRLGQTIVIADENGKPLEITAEEAYRRYHANR